MNSSTKWTAVSFFALTALAGASVAFAGCTVTSGKIDDVEGGTGTRVDAGNEAATVNACPSNTKQTIGPIVNAKCQGLLEAKCCSELTTCFDIDVTKTDAGPSALDCNKYTQCSDKCNDEKVEADKIDCQKGCNAATPKSVQDAYGAIEACTTKNPDVLAACQ